MPRTTKRRARKPSRGNGRALNQTMKQLVEIDRTTQLRGSPRIPDAMPIRISKNHVTTVEKTFSVQTTTSGGNPSSLITFNLNDLADAAAFQELFTHYRVAQMRVQFTHMSSFISPSTTIAPADFATALIPVPNQNDLTLVTTGADLLEFDTVQVVPGTFNGTDATTVTQFTERVVAPRWLTIASGVVQGSFRGYQSTEATNTTPWYGVYVSPVSSQATQTATYSYYVTVVLNFKSSR